MVGPEDRTKNDHDNGTDDHTTDDRGRGRISGRVSVDGEKAVLLGYFFDREGHGDRNESADDRRTPEEPFPIQRIDVDHAEQGETGEKRGAKSKNSSPAEIDHETKDPGETAAFGFREPGCFDFGHARRAKRLEVTVDAAYGDKQAKNPIDACSAKEEV